MILNVLLIFGTLGYLFKCLIKHQPVPLWDGIILAFVVVVFVLLSFRAFQHACDQRDEAKRQLDEAKGNVASPSPSKRGELTFDIDRLFHDGRGILAQLEKAKPNVADHSYAQVCFEAWFSNVSDILATSIFAKVWYDKKVVDYRHDRIDDYIQKCKLAVDTHGQSPWHSLMTSSA